MEESLTEAKWRAEGKEYKMVCQVKEYLFEGKKKSSVTQEKEASKETHNQDVFLLLRR